MFKICNYISYPLPLLCFSNPGNLPFHFNIPLSYFCNFSIFQFFLSVFSFPPFIVLCDHNYFLSSLDFLFSHLFSHYNGSLTQVGSYYQRISDIFWLLCFICFSFVDFNSISIFNSYTFGFHWKFDYLFIYLFLCWIYE